MKWFEGWLRGTLDNFWTAHRDRLAKKHRRTLNELLQGKITLVEAIKTLADIERELIERGLRGSPIDSLERLEYVNEHLRVIINRLKEVVKQ